MGHRDSEAPAASAAAAGRVVNVTGDGGAAPGDEATFDTNMVIILAALFFGLLFAIVLNSLARCALRCGGRGAAGGAEGASSGGASCVGSVRKRALRSIPVEVYGRGEEDSEEDVCAICLGEFADGEKVRVLPRCGHRFHVRCVDVWLVSRGSCPTCRRPVMGGAPAKGGGSVGRSRRPDSDTIAVVIV
ncbi:RING-H2 finger protein ATL74-like [Phragmites australis]|uniref:RING-H2 finger protein ATL74-like n=1 Tax=Phragmites australis TaxID=29695 RepID=UPI002D791E16|nr:RING-H2 finger protein ATL74-like [Phragmites australis]